MPSAPEDTCKVRRYEESGSPCDDDTDCPTGEDLCAEAKEAVDDCEREASAHPSGQYGSAPGSRGAPGSPTSPAPAPEG